MQRPTIGRYTGRPRRSSSAADAPSSFWSLQCATYHCLVVYWASPIREFDCIAVIWWAAGAIHGPLWQSVYTIQDMLRLPSMRRHSDSLRYQPLAVLWHSSRSSGYDKLERCSFHCVARQPDGSCAYEGMVYTAREDLIKWYIRRDNTFVISQQRRALHSNGKSAP